MKRQRGHAREAAGPDSGQMDLGRGWRRAHLGGGAGGARAGPAQANTVQLSVHLEPRERRRQLGNLRGLRRFLFRVNCFLAWASVLKGQNVSELP